MSSMEISTELGIIITVNMPSSLAETISLAYPHTTDMAIKALEKKWDLSALFINRGLDDPHSIKHITDAAEYYQANQNFPPGAKQLSIAKTVSEQSFRDQPLYIHSFQQDLDGTTFTFSTVLKGMGSSMQIDCPRWVDRGPHTNRWQHQQPTAIEIKVAHTNEAAMIKLPDNDLVFMYLGAPNIKIAEELLLDRIYGLSITQLQNRNLRPGTNNNKRHL